MRTPACLQVLSADGREFEQHGLPRSTARRDAMRTHAAQFDQSSADLHAVVPAQTEALIALQRQREWMLGDILEIPEQSLVSQSLVRRVRNGQPAAHRLPAAATPSDDRSTQRRRSSCWLRQIGPANPAGSRSPRHSHVITSARSGETDLARRATRSSARLSAQTKASAASEETPPATPRRRSTAGTPRTSRR